MTYKGYQIKSVRDCFLVEGLLFGSLSNAKWYVRQVIDDGVYAKPTSYAMTVRWERFDGEVYVHNRGWIAEWCGQPLKRGGRNFFGP